MQTNDYKLIELFVLDSNHSSVGKKISLGSFKNDIYKLCLEIIYLIYMYKKALVLNNLQRFIFHKTQPNQYFSLIKVFL